jgi:outer membrane lipoprotein SlyB
MNPVTAESSGTCTFNVPASQLPHLGELTIQVTITPVALQISFWKDSNLLGVYAGSSAGGFSGKVGGGKWKFVNGTCQS